MTNRTNLNIILLAITFTACGQSPNNTELSAASHSSNGIESKIEASFETEADGGSYVDTVTPVIGQSVDMKIFSASGGDVAMNGSYVYLGIMAEDNDQWLTFELANVTEHKLISSKENGQLTIRLTRQTFDAADNIIEVESNLFLNVASGQSGTISAEEKALDGTIISPESPIKATSDEMIAGYSAVNSVTNVADPIHTVKIFDLVQGDSAMNGRLLCLAVYKNQMTGWVPFILADVASYDVLPSRRAGFMKLKLHRDTIDEDGTIRPVPSILYINLSHSEEGTLEVEEQK